MASSNASVAVTIVIGVIVIAGLGYTYYTTSSDLSSLSNQKTSLSQQLSSLGQQNFNLNQQIASLDQQLSSQDQQFSNQNQQISNLDQQVSSLNQQVSTLEQRTVQVVSITNTLVTLETTTSVVTSTVTSISAVPQSSLVVTADSYDNTTNVFTFRVQSTQNYTVYAQLSASFYGLACEFNAGEGGYISQVYTFPPQSNTTTTLNLRSVTFSPSGFCGKEPIAYFDMTFVVTSTAVSPSYQFDVVPGYQF